MEFPFYGNSQALRSEATNKPESRIARFNLLAAG